MDGFGACEKCPLSGTDKCGGKNILATHKNSKGYIVNNKGVTEDKNQSTGSKKKKGKKK